ncbi:MAG: calcium/proton exchanger [Anaerolineae bacterium]
MRAMRLMLVALPIAIAAEVLHWHDTMLFVASAIAIIPLAAILSEATEALAERTGPRIGGLLNATLGNAAELIIVVVAINAGRTELVKASIVGSILGNLLLVLGFSLLLGGLKNGVQRFDRSKVTIDATMTILAAIVISVPSLFISEIGDDFVRVESLSLLTAAVVMLLYIASIVYTLRESADDRRYGPVIEPSHNGPDWSPAVATGIMAVAVVGIAVMSEYLVASLDSVTHTMGLSEFFVGIIVVPIIGNVAEHTVAVKVAMEDKMDLSLAIAFGSSLQIALFVAPMVVFLSLLIGHPVNLEFTTPEVVASIAASIIAAMVAFDGRSNWLEGAMLLVVYLILAVGFFYLPGAM